MEAAQLADDLKAQLEMAQKKLHDFQDEIVENSVTKEKDMFNFKRAQVSCFFFPFCLLGVFWALKWPVLRVTDLLYVISYLTPWVTRQSLFSSLQIIPKAYPGAYHVMGVESVLIYLNEWVSEIVKNYQ